MTIYDSKTGKAECLNAREVAPAAATENMFGGNASLSIKGNQFLMKGCLKLLTSSFKKGNLSHVKNRLKTIKLETHNFWFDT